MLEDPPILTVKRPTRRPTRSQIEAFRGAMTGNIADCMGVEEQCPHLLNP